MKIPIINIQEQYSRLQNEIEPVVMEVLRSGHYVLGPKLAEFEKKAAGFLGVKHAIGCDNGSNAITMALLALDIQSGDEVITTPFTYIATAEAITQVGAKPVFADIDPDTYNIDPKAIESKITDKTKAVIVVHLYGQCCDMDAILDITERYNFKLIEDAAQAFGATYTQKKFAGTMGDIGTYSFYPTKNLACAGDGGLMVTNSDELAARLRKIRVHGSDKRYYHDIRGFNSRLDEIQAAILLVKLKYISEWNQRRAQIAEIYNAAFNPIEFLRVPKVSDKAKHIFHQYTLRLDPEKSGLTRDEFRAKLHERGISAEIYYPIPLHMQEVYKSLGYQALDFPNTFKASQEIICLPIYPELSLEEINYVVQAVKELLPLKSKLVKNAG